MSNDGNAETALTVDWSSPEMALRLLNAAAAAIVALDVEDRVRYWSPAATELFGWTAPEVLGQPCPLVPREQQDEFAQLVHRVLTGTTISGLEFSRQRRDGTHIEIAATASPLRDESGDIVAALFIGTDNAERKRIAEELRRSHQFINAVAVASPHITYVYDVQKRQQTYISRNVVRDLGYSTEQAEAMKSDVLRHIMHPDDLRRLPELLARWDTARDDQLLETEYRLRHADGTWRWLLGRSRVFQRDEQGRVQQIVGTSQDITERKRIAEELLHSHQFIKAVAEASPHITYVFDIQKQCSVYISRQFERDLGYAPQQAQDLGAQMLPTLLHPDDAKRIPELLARWDTAVDGQVFETEYRMRHIDGTWRWFVGRDTVFERDERGRVRQILGTAQDITERKLGEAALRDNEARHAAILQVSVDAIVLVDHAGRVVDFNPAAETMFGYSRAEVVGRAIDELVVPAAVRAEYRARLAEFLATNDRVALNQRLEVVAQRADGTQFPVELSITCTHVRGLPLFVGFIRDLTDVKRAEAERRALEQRFQQAQKLESLGILAGGIAHDFNNTLTSILGYADLALLSLPPDSPVRDHINQVLAGARQAADLTHQMLAYSGKGRFQVQLAQLADVVREIGHLLQVSISKKCILRYDFAQALPPVEADAVQLRQVVMNLVLNAADAIGDADGVISVRTGRRFCDQAFLRGSYVDEDLPAGDYVTLAVADTGCGMSPETLQRIFDPFFTTKFTGRGLGLAAVFGIVRGHHGAIRVESVLGRGTTFTVLLPAAPQASTVPNTGAGASADWHARGAVLIVDAEAAARGLAETLLQRLGLATFGAADGRMALELLRTHGPTVRLALLDLTMPQGDAVETLRQLRAMQPGIRIIVSSDFDEPTAGEFLNGDPSVTYLQKPYRIDELTRAVRQALSE